MKAPELKCLFHKGVICMANGTLHLQQSVIPGTKEYTDAVEVWGVEAGEGIGAFRTEVGHFCTIHALYSWLLDQGAMTTPKNAMGAKRRPPPANPQARPTVAQRRPRQPLTRRPT